MRAQAWGPGPDGESMKECAERYALGRRKGSTQAMRACVQAPCFGRQWALQDACAAREQLCHAL